jgi:hypothetical protein
MAYRGLRVLSLVVLIGCGAAVAEAQTVLVQTTTARSYGMGRSGAGDGTDPLNAVMNPALLSVSGLVVGGNIYPDLVVSGDNNKAWNGILGGGTRWNSGENNTAGISVAAVYSTVIRDDDYGDDPLAQQRYYGGMAALQYVFNNKTTVGFGAGVKSYSATEPPYDYYYYLPYLPNPPREIHSEALLADVGLLLSTRTYTESGKSVRPAIGLSYTNFGGRIRRDSGQETDPPTQIRFGFSMEVTSAAAPDDGSGKWHKPPSWRFVFNSDVIDDTEGSGGGLSAGMELSIRDIGFLRLGTDAVQGGEHLTAGLGVGYNTGRTRIRVDYARLPAWRIDENYRVPLDHFGLTVGYAWD